MVRLADSARLVQLLALPHPNSCHLLPIWRPMRDMGLHRFSSGHDLFDGADLVQLHAGHFKVEVAIVLDRIPVGVEQGRVPVAEGLWPSVPW